jgi:predicted short-subunit dehydrogenase-like oxidoreductase (DUF2520 family)
MATHAVRYLELSSLPYRQWSRSRGGDMLEALDGCDPVLLLVSDGAIASVASTLHAEPQRTLVHFSGAIHTPLAAGMHPLCTFGPEPYDLDTYRDIPFICEAGGPAFDTVFPELPNPHFAIDPDRKPLYHALAVLGGNFTTILWTKLFDGFERGLGLPRAVALPYLKRVVANLADAPDAALTGPVSRGDRATVRANLEALSGDPFQAVYRAFVEAVNPALLEEER